MIALLIGGLIFFLVSGTSFDDIFQSSADRTASYYDETFESDSYSEDTAAKRTTSTTRATTEADAETGEYYRVSVGKNNRLSLRAQPDENSKKLDRIDSGTRLYITEIRGNWGKTTYDGESGWVCLRMDGDTYCVKE